MCRRLLMLILLILIKCSMLTINIIWCVINLPNRIMTNQTKLNEIPSSETDCTHYFWYTKSSLVGFNKLANSSGRALLLCGEDRGRTLSRGGRSPLGETSLIRQARRWSVLLPGESGDWRYFCRSRLTPITKSRFLYNWP